MRLTALIETPRLELRLWTAVEVSTLVNLCASAGFDDYSTGRFQNMDYEKGNLFISEEQKTFRELGMGRLGVFLRIEGIAVGICGLYTMTDTNFLGKVGIAYRFPKEHWGKGYAPEAARALMEYGFKSLSLDSVSAIIDPENTRSIRVVEKIGMNFVSDVIYKNEARQHWISSVGPHI